jgi:hypothetical protein
MYNEKGGELMEQTDRSRPAWGADWLLPKNFTIAWGARAIADKNYDKLKKGTHVASLLYDRQGAAGNLKHWNDLKNFIDNKILPIQMDYDGSSTEVTKVDDEEFHARWTPNGSYGYIYVVVWMD